ncbi:MAG: cell division ATP-binding protein FtsE [bacterium]|nr:cell division ATP-binding protein FtsE [bacterium]
MILLSNVSKRYGGHLALDQLSVEIKDGEFVFLIGPSGAGKTTLLRLLIRDIIQTSGTITIDDWNVDSLPSSKVYLLRRKIGTVFQDFKLLMGRTVFENVALGLEILGKKEQEVKKDVSQILELVGLVDKKTMFPLQLSAGELQRIAIARALAGGPKILLADEPTGNLDPETSESILDILREANRIGTTVIMATHNASIVNMYKKRTITLEDGILTSDEEKGRYTLRAKKKKQASDAPREEDPKRTHENA